MPPVPRRRAPAASLAPDARQRRRHSLLKQAAAGPAPHTFTSPRRRRDPPRPKPSPSTRRFARAHTTPEHPAAEPCGAVRSVESRHAPSSCCGGGGSPDNHRHGWPNVRLVPRGIERPKAANPGKSGYSIAWV